MAKILLISCVVLLVLLVIIYRQNESYKSDNNRLIIQNDSMLSENIELKKMIIAVDTSIKRNTVFKKKK